MLIQIRWTSLFKYVGFVSLGVNQVDGCNKNARPTDMRVLLPHEVLAAMAESQHYVFQSVLLGHLPDDARVAFWKHVSGLEPWKDHPIINRGSWERLVGIHIHGDGCEFYKEDEYFVWSWSSIFATAGSIKDVLMFRFPIAVIPERLMRTAFATLLVIVIFTGFPIY